MEKETIFIILIIKDKIICLTSQVLIMATNRDKKISIKIQKGIILRKNMIEILEILEEKINIRSDILIKIKQKMHIINRPIHKRESMHLLEIINNQIRKLRE